MSKSRPARLNLSVEVTPLEQGLRALGVLEHFAAGEVSMMLDRPVLHGAKVRVRFRNAGFLGEVVFCEPKGELYEAHVMIAESDALGMRRTVRFPVDMPAQVLSAKPGESPDARIVDISAEGMGLELLFAPVVGETVAIESESSIAFVIIRHCVQLPNGRFRAGGEMLHVAGKTAGAGNVAKGSGLRGLLRKFSAGEK
jgi:hypothetical protein